MSKNRNESFLPIFDGSWWFYDTRSEESRLNAYFISQIILAGFMTLYFLGSVSIGLFVLDLTGEERGALVDRSAKLLIIFIVYIVLLFWAISSARWLYYYARGYRMAVWFNVLSLDSHPFFSLLSAVVYGVILAVAVLIGSIIGMFVVILLKLLLGFSLASMILLAFIFLSVCAIVMRKRNISKYEVLYKISGEKP